MKMVPDSLFKSSIRAFLVAFFGGIGVLLGLFLITVVLVGIFSTKDEKAFSSDVTILADANGSRKELSSSTPVILQISIDGAIGKDELTGKKMEQILLDSREEDFKNGRIKGILLMINSPGGGVNDADIIYRLLKHYKTQYQVPIYTYVNGLCASGGYYIACASDKIFASNVSVIGSIGVISWPPFMNVTDTMKKIGIDSITVSAGKGKDEMNPFRTWGPDEQKERQKLIDYFYNQFVDLVDTNRPLVTREELVSKLGAKVLPSPEAKSFGLIDVSGVMRADALRELTREAGIEKDEKYQVVCFETKSWWRKMLREQRYSPLFTGRVKHEFVLPNSQSEHPLQYLYMQ